MLFEGKIHAKKKGEKHHSVEVPELGVFTEGKNVKECHAMVKDAIELLVDQEGFTVDVLFKSDTKFFVKGSDLRPLVAIFLKETRAKAGLSLNEVQKRLGLKSVNGYAQYEHAKALPAMDRLAEFVKVMRPEIDLVIGIKKVV